jgi:hypothetical protein
MRTMKRIPVRYVLLGLLVVALAVLIAACGGSSKTTTTNTTAAPTTSTEAMTTTSGASSSTTGALTGDEATIAANWVKFFDGSLPVADKIGLLENGDQYKAQLEAQAASTLAKMATASVSAVKITSANTADVTYSIMAGGLAVLPDQPGKAFLQDGTWKVSAESFLALLALQQGSAPTTPST